MALIARERFPTLGASILPVVIASTVFFELLGPLSTRAALTLAGEVRQGEEGDAAPGGS